VIFSLSERTFLPLALEDSGYPSALGGSLSEELALTSSSFALFEVRAFFLGASSSSDSSLPDLEAAFLPFLA